MYTTWPLPESESMLPQRQNKFWRVPIVHGGTAGMFCLHAYRSMNSTIQLFCRHPCGIQRRAAFVCLRSVCTTAVRRTSERAGKQRYWLVVVHFSGQGRPAVAQATTRSTTMIHINGHSRDHGWLDAAGRDNIYSRFRTGCFVVFFLRRDIFVSLGFVVGINRRSTCTRF